VDAAHSLLEYWFGDAGSGARALEERMRFWFGSGHDVEIRAKFGELARRAADGELAAWADSPRRRLALILLLDQMPRNLHRGSAEAFAQDDKALALALSGMQVGADAALSPVERMFFYMPLQHAESREVQDESVAAFRRLVGEAPEEMRGAFDAGLRYAELHRQIIERFGRFPHRNRVLGRESTREEIEYLESAETFGQ
jgi:uncharacterized protein (DUF924 family)